MGLICVRASITTDLISIFVLNLENQNFLFIPWVIAFFNHSTFMFSTS